MLRKEHHIEIALREGRLRCSAHFYNAEAQLDRLVTYVEERVGFAGRASA